MSGPVVDQQCVSIYRDARKTSPSATAFLDTLRFIAAHLVLLSHLPLVFIDNRLAQGRDLAIVTFFVLSGFLVTRSLLSRAGQPGPQLSTFLADRVARIMTPLVPVLLIIALLNATVIHANWSLDGLGTLAIQLWMYVAAGLLLFGVLLREKLRGGYFWILAFVIGTVVIWLAADDTAQPLPLIWIVGGFAGFVAAHISTHPKVARSETVATCVFIFGALALAVLVVNIGLDPYDLQTVVLMTVIFLAIFLRLNQAATAWNIPAAVAKFFASYSYSLFLVHNTVLVLVFEYAVGLPQEVSIGIAVVLAHAAALLVYHLFEKHHRVVGSWLRRPMMQSGPRPATELSDVAEPCDQLKP